MKQISRSYLLWISATILSILLYFFAFHFFPQTFPLIHLNITMDMEQALEQADTIAQQHNFGPSDYRSAAMFHTDEATKTFVELEAGKDTLVSIMEEKLYMPYTWMVRHFKEHEKNETTIIFTPDGKPYGFIETIAENTPGPELSENDARQLAQDVAVRNWNIDFTHYKLVETSQKTELSKRIDHTFVYERIDKKIGEGTYRLKIVVSGDKVTELQHFIKVPEAFTRRFTEMRSSNALISFISRIIIFLFYFLGGLIGLYLIFRKRWYIIYQPLIMAFVLALLSVLTAINQLPSAWMHYNSAISTNVFFMQKLLSLFISLVFSTALYALIIMMAENLTRLAFAHHPQLWSVFSRENSSSYAILGRTFGSYLLVGFNVAFIIAFYLFSFRYLGWWSPSETLFDPNVLATYAPWFTPLALSLNAGFIEECLFRAIPLAGAALLGTHFGKKNWWIGITLILQVLVFGAAHADYPQLPSYARLVEMFIPSLIWGIIYLKFGLLTTIISHYVYDVIWFSIPIFITQTQDTVTYKIMILIGIFLPLCIVLYARLRKGRWIELPAISRNAAWQPGNVVEKEESGETVEVMHSPSSSSCRAQKSIIILGIFGLIAWIATTRFTHDGVTITVNRDYAVNLSNAFLKEKNNMLTAAPWQTLPLMFNDYKSVPQIASQHIFVWKKGKKELYNTFLGTYLQPAHWTIRYAQFDTDLIARAEEYKIMLYDNKIWRSHHQLPESTIGRSLTQQEARSLVHKTIQEQYDINPTELIEISATQTQLPHRINWLFIFSDESRYPLPVGQARISVLIAGDEVVDAERTIHVPEEWERKQQNKQLLLNIIILLFTIILLFFLGIGIIAALRQKRTFVFSKQLFLLLLGTSIMIFIIDVINCWPSIIGGFNTSLPLQNQLFQFIAFYGIAAVLKSVFYAFILSSVLLFKTKNHQVSATWNFSIGICLGLFAAGILSCAQMLLPINVPLWPDYDALAYSLPLLASLLHTIMHYAQLTIIFSLLYILVDTATNQWQKKRFLFTIIAALCGMSMITLPALKALPLWIIIGSTIGCMFILLYRRVIGDNYALIPLATASFFILKIIQQGVFNAYPQALLAAMLNSAMIIAATLLWHCYIHKNTH